MNKKTLRYILLIPVMLILWFVYTTGQVNVDDLATNLTMWLIISLVIFVTWLWTGKRVKA